MTIDRAERILIRVAVVWLIATPLWLLFSIVRLW
jgi:hypothetical protein